MEVLPVPTLLDARISPLGLSAIPDPAPNGAPAMRYISTVEFPSVFHDPDISPARVSST